MPKRSQAPSSAVNIPESIWLTRWFTSARREGFLSLLTPEVWHTLSAVLSFTSRSGSCVFTLDQLAHAIGQSREISERRIQALPAVLWQDQPLATLEYDRYGELAGAILLPLEIVARLTSDAAESVDPASSSSEMATSSDRARLREDLQAIGLSPIQVDGLIATYPVDRIERQLQWLAARAARNPAALLIRAVEGDWEAPKEEA